MKCLTNCYVHTSAVRGRAIFFHFGQSRCHIEDSTFHSLHSIAPNCAGPQDACITIETDDERTVSDELNGQVLYINFSNVDPSIYAGPGYASCLCCSSHIKNNLYFHSINFFHLGDTPIIYIKVNYMQLQTYNFINFESSEYIMYFDYVEFANDGRQPKLNVNAWFKDSPLEPTEVIKNPANVQIQRAEWRADPVDINHPTIINEASCFVLYSAALLDIRTCGSVSVPPTRSPSPSESPSRSPTQSPTQSPLPTASRSVAPTASQSPLPTASISAVPTPSQSPTQSPLPSPTQSPTESPSQSPIATPRGSPLATPSLFPDPTATQSPFPSPTQSPTESPSPSPMATPSLSPLPSVSQSPDPTPSQSPFPCTLR